MYCRAISSSQFKFFEFWWIRFRFRLYIALEMTVGVRVEWECFDWDDCHEFDFGEKILLQTIRITREAMNSQSAYCGNDCGTVGTTARNGWRWQKCESAFSVASLLALLTWGGSWGARLLILRLSLWLQFLFWISLEITTKDCPVCPVWEAIGQNVADSMCRRPSTIEPAKEDTLLLSIYCLWRTESDAISRFVC